MTRTTRITGLLAVLAAGLASGRLTAAANEAGPPRERDEVQKPGLPPPYYYYRFGAPTTEHRDLTVEEAIGLALTHASTYQQARLDEQVAGEDVRQAHAAFRPQLTLPVSYYGNTPSLVRDPDGTRPPSFAPANGIHEATALLTAAGTVDLAGRLHAALQKSQQLLAAAHAGSQAAQRALVLGTVDAYYGLSLARQKRRLADESLALAESFALLTGELVESGQAEETERLRARAEALRRRDELEQARVGESSASDLLHALTGLPPATHLGVVRPTSDLPPLEGFETYSTEALARRPEIGQLEALRHAALSDVEAARAERRPQLGYALTAGVDAIEVGPFRRYVGAAAQVSVVVPLSTFGASHSREAQAGLRAESLQVQRESALRQIQQEFYTSRATAFAALDRVRESQERATASEKSLNLLLVRYRERKATITEVIDAQGAYSDSRSAYYQAITDYGTARVRLLPDPSTSSFAARAGEAPAAPPLPTCAVPLEQAPEVEGWRLGALLESLRARWPGTSVPAPDAFGVVTVERDGTEPDRPAPTDPAFAVVHTTLRFLDGRLFFARAVYSGDTTWETKDAFLTAAAARLGLPGPWKAFYDWSDKSLDDAEDLRDLAVECAGFRVRVGLGFFSEGVRRRLTPHVKLEDVEVARAVRLREEQERRQAAREAAKGKP